MTGRRTPGRTGSARMGGRRGRRSWRPTAPPDRRTLTGRLCGDPQPGRSALARQTVPDLFGAELRAEIARLAVEADTRFGAADEAPAGSPSASQHPKDPA